MAGAWYKYKDEKVGPQHATQFTCVVDTNHFYADKVDWLILIWTKMSSGVRRVYDIGGPDIHGIIVRDCPS